MDMKKLTSILLTLGCLITAGALLWWLYFYGQYVGLKGNVGQAVSCLYSSGGSCGLISSFSQIGGTNPYNPVLFWIGIALLGVGIILRLSLKNDSA